MLAFSVFLILISENIPATSETIPLIGIYLTFTMSLTSLSIFLSITVLHFYHSGQSAPELHHSMYFFMTRKIASIIGMTETVRKFETFKDKKTKNSYYKKNLFSQESEQSDNLCDTLKMVQKELGKVRNNPTKIPDNHKTICFCFENFYKSTKARKRSLITKKNFIDQNLINGHNISINSIRSDQSEKMLNIYNSINNKNSYCFKNYKDICNNYLITNSSSMQNEFYINGKTFQRNNTVEEKQIYELFDKNNFFSTRALKKTLNYQCQHKNNIVCQNTQTKLEFRQFENLQNLLNLFPVQNINSTSWYKNYGTPSTPTSKLKCKCFSDHVRQPSIEKNDYLNTIDLLTRKMKLYLEKQDFKTTKINLRNEWKLIALIFDRFLFWIFTVLTVISSILLLVILPILKDAGFIKPVYKPEF